MKPLSVHLEPAWHITGPTGQPLPARAMFWLAEVERHGSLSAACKAAGASYRHTWSLLEEAEAAMGAPLVVKARGKGSQLTALGQALVWAQRRFDARLRPQLDSVAFELQAELHRVLSDVARPLRVFASHGFAIEVLQRLLTEADTPLEWRYTDSSQALAALRAGLADVASLHLPIGPLQASVLRHHARCLDPDWLYVHMVTRRQGLMVKAGNPLHIDGLTDLLRPDVRFVARAQGSGTRLLLETLLQARGLDPSAVSHGPTGEHTHSAIAAYVASGMADVGFGVETSARRFGLEFIPVQTECYGLLMPPGVRASPAADTLITLLQSPACQALLQRLEGYRPDRCGEVTPARACFEAWAEAARTAPPAAPWSGL
ncbi:MAG: substrate-binding domain-containing protein [Aquabacterium sp.]